MADLEKSYLVLARKYRSQTFDDLVGQDVLVKTLKNAILAGRIAHAYILTGIRGVGKTSTARILAKAFNCTGADGKATAPQVTPCGVCENCRAIAEDRHVDVLELDAASKNGVDDIRDIIEGVQYKPSLGRYKVYIIDEVHMLSKAAFNALLKTLEEPPEHVKFIFATTEIRKVPATILSRCQRFDLARLDMADLVAHFKSVLEAEKISYEDEAIKIIARAADGSVRDGLSLLDQAIVLSDGEVKTENVISMLGLLDRTKEFELFEAIAEGDTAKSLDLIKKAYDTGASSLTVLKDLMDIVYLSLRFIVAPVGDLGLTDEEMNYLKKFASKLDVGYLTLAWQILLKGIAELQATGNEMKALEVIIIKLIYAKNMPSIEDSIKVSESKKTMPMLQVAQPKVSVAVQSKYSQPENLDEVVKVLEIEREAILACMVKDNARLVNFEHGRIEINFDAGAPDNIHQKMGAVLSKALGCDWQIIRVEEAGGKTISEQKKAAAEKSLEQAMQNDDVKNVIDIFKGATIAKVHQQDVGDNLSEETEGE